MSVTSTAIPIPCPHGRKVAIIKASVHAGPLLKSSNSLRRPSKFCALHLCHAACGTLVIQDESTAVEPAKSLGPAKLDFYGCMADPDAVRSAAELL